RDRGAVADDLANLVGVGPVVITRAQLNRPCLQLLARQTELVDRRDRRLHDALGLRLCRRGHLVLGFDPDGYINEVRDPIHAPGAGGGDRGLRRRGRLWADLGKRPGGYHGEGEKYENADGTYFADAHTTSFWKLRGL